MVNAENITLMAIAKKGESVYLKQDIAEKAILGKVVASKLVPLDGCFALDITVDDEECGQIDCHMVFDSIENVEADNLSVIISQNAKDKWQISAR